MLIRVMMVVIALLIAGCEAAVPVPLPVIPEGWEVMQGDGISLALPDGYIGGELTEEVINLIDEALDPEFDSLIDGIRQDPDFYALWLFDDTDTDPNFVTNVNAVTTDMGSPMPLSAIADQVISSLPEGMTVVGNEDFPHDVGPAIRLTLDTNLEGIVSSQVAYLIISANRNLWVLTYSTSPDQFEERLPIFDESARTFRVTG